MLEGVIKAGDIAHHAPQIVHDYGFRVFWRCVICVCCHQQRTFLGCVFDRRTHWARRLSYRLTHPHARA